MTILAKINDDFKIALKTKDKTKRSALSLLKSAIGNYSISKRVKDDELTDLDIINVIRKEISKIKDSIDAYKAANRIELVEAENQVLEILNDYLPAPLSVEELEKIIETAIKKIEATSIKQMGLVIKKVQEVTAGRTDNQTISSIVKSKLSTK